ncbi:MAG: LAGLIDADG family homing endonuclease [Methanoregula sp.]|jgi:hypothetical protein
MIKEEYIAGIVDGEGSFTLQISERKWKDGRTGIGLNPRVQIGFKHSANEEEVLKKIQEHLGGGKIYISNKDKPNAMMVLWTTNTADTIRYCEMLLPHLIIKKRQAGMLLEACKLIRTRTEERAGKFLGKGTKIYSEQDYQKLVEISTTMNEGRQIERWRNAKGRNKDYYLDLVRRMFAKWTNGKFPDDQ